MIAGRFACQFATWTFRYHLRRFAIYLDAGRFAPLDVSITGRFPTFLDVSPPVSKLVICDTVTLQQIFFCI